MESLKIEMEFLYKLYSCESIFSVFCMANKIFEKKYIFKLKVITVKGENNKDVKTLLLKSNNYLSKNINASEWKARIFL